MDELYEKKKRTRRSKKNKNIKNNKKKVNNTYKSNKPTKTNKSSIEINKDIDYTLDGSVKQLFLNLTKMQIPFDYENTLEEYFPDDMEKDSHGNYYKIIGDNDVMFCAHLDTYCYYYQPVHHIIDDNIIKTNGTSTLGADDKAGVVIMLKMMEAGIPGLYYFFRGEEGVTSPNGTWGSRQALKTREDFFKNYNKCIAFDRRGNNSIISQQMYSECCSEDFVKSLQNEFSNNGLEYKDDDTGMWCDSGVFMEIIPECTNISVGYKSEHTYNEIQDIDHLDKLVNACINIDWDNLPTKRDPSIVSYGIGNYKYGKDYDWEWDYYKNKYKNKYKGNKGNLYSGDGNRQYDSMDDMFYHVCDILNQIGYNCLNTDSFEEAEEMYFQNFDTNDFFGLRIVDYEIYISEDEQLRKFINVGDIDEFENYVIGGYEEINNTHIVDNNIKNDFSSEQIDAFISIVNVNPQLIIDSMQDMIQQNNKDAKKSLSADLWMEVEKQILDMGYPVDYTSSGEGINPDDLTDWISDNWDNLLVKLKSYKEKKGFIKKARKSQLYTNEQKEIFSGIVDTSKELVRLVLKDLDINDQPVVRDKLIEYINEDLISKGYEKKIKKGLKNINAYEFVNWCYDNYDEIKEYYD